MAQLAWEPGALAGVREFPESGNSCRPPSVYSDRRQTRTRRQMPVATDKSGAVLRSIYTLFTAGTVGGLADRQLLERLRGPGW